MFLGLSLSWTWWVGLGLVILTIIALVVFCIFYQPYRGLIQHQHTDEQRAKQHTIKNVVISLFAFLLFLITNILVWVAGIMGLRALEQQKLFVPKKLDSYRKLDGVLYTLPSGALLYRANPDAPSTARRLLFLHGNTHHIDAYHEPLKRLTKYGYDVWAVEYRGYGCAPGTANAENMLQDAMEAWNIMGDANGIVVGFSIGGGVLGQIYELLMPQPAQVVFASTFYSVPALLTDKFGELGAIVAPFLKTQWVIRAPTTYKGKVLVLFSRDDSTVPPSSSEALCQVFVKSDLVCRELPDGGHRFGAYLHVPSWVTDLLPPTI
jgi:hypothetical protein